MRQDLTEREMSELLRRSDRVAAKLCAGVVLDAWTPDDASKLRRLIGELQRLRDREASVMHLHNLEQAY